MPLLPLALPGGSDAWQVFGARRFSPDPDGRHPPDYLVGLPTRGEPGSNLNSSIAYGRPIAAIPYTAARRDELICGHAWIRDAGHGPNELLGACRPTPRKKYCSEPWF